MIQHSMIIDGFFNNPDEARALLLEQDIMDYEASDKVVYPGIIHLPEVIEESMQLKLNYLFQNRAEITYSFARFSFETMTPPNWAHSDRNMTQFVGLVYMSPVDHPEDGTYTLRHKRTGMFHHPRNQEEMDLLLADSNKKEEWEVTFKCPSVYNRLFVLNAELIHAAGPSFGTTKEDSRLVLTAFFNLK